MSGAPAPRDLLLVAADGAVGVLARWAGTALVPPSREGWPTGTLLVNLVGALALGALLGSLPAAPRGGRLRLLLGTGLLGGFTTYSALAVEAVQLAAASPLLAVGYALTSAAAGVLACAAGLGLARAVAPGPARVDQRPPRAR
ncbi:CrcB family protein [Quadrisphaera sp. DSM 44207]|uniref:CrcB family protein n=1 Tax=Quadrisphaera sp. DSM 44207 TaxID=1881057 RepID=UPI0008900E77|nr:CrcB family protein [Quadrisphaera sp. DSM 44207]SDQ13778.1 CrcB protein [Quadrisphaera sp. DSM 44207]